MGLCTKATKLKEYRQALKDNSIETQPTKEELDAIGKAYDEAVIKHLEKLGSDKYKAEIAKIKSGKALTQKEVDNVNKNNTSSSSTITPETVQTKVLDTTNRETINITPSRAVDAKAKTKGSLSNKYIGIGIQNSSTLEYANQSGNKANQATYTEDDVVFVSVGGKRGAKALRNKAQQDTVDLAIKALDSGAIILTDNAEYTRKSTYNEGEQLLSKTLTDKGYTYTEVTKDGQVIGVWYKGDFKSEKKEPKTGKLSKEQKIQYESSELLKVIYTEEEFTKMVNESTKDMVNPSTIVYHGSGSAIKEFKVTKGNNRDSNLGVFFTDNIKNAIYYSLLSNKQPEWASRFEDHKPTVEFVYQEMVKQKSTHIKIMDYDTNKEIEIHVMASIVDFGNNPSIEEHGGKNKAFTEAEKNKTTQRLNTSTALINTNMVDGLYVSNISLIKDMRKVKILNKGNNTESQKEAIADNVFDMSVITQENLEAGKFKEVYQAILSGFSELNWSEAQLEVLDEFKRLRANLIQLNKGNNTEAIDAAVKEAQNYSANLSEDFLLYSEDGVVVEDDFKSFIKAAYYIVEKSNELNVYDATPATDINNFFKELDKQDFGEFGNGLVKKVVDDYKQMRKDKPKMNPRTVFRAVVGSVGFEQKESKPMYQYLKSKDKLQFLDGKELPAQWAYVNSINLIADAVNFGKDATLYKLFFEKSLDTKALANHLRNVGTIPMIEKLNTLLVHKPEAKGKEPKKHTITIQSEFYNRSKVEQDTDSIYLFGDNTNDRTVTHYVPQSTQAVIRGLPNALGIDTKKNRKTIVTSYFKDKDLELFKQHLKEVEDKINQYKKDGKNIVLPKDGIGTGKAKLKEKAPLLYNELVEMLNRVAENDNYMIPVKIADTNSKKEISTVKDKQPTTSEKDPIVPIENHTLDFLKTLTTSESFEAFKKQHLAKYDMYRGGIGIELQTPSGFTFYSYNDSAFALGFVLDDIKKAEKDPSDIYHKLKVTYIQAFNNEEEAKQFYDDRKHSAKEKPVAESKNNDTSKKLVVKQGSMVTDMPVEIQEMLNDINYPKHLSRKFYERIAEGDFDASEAYNRYVTELKNKPKSKIDKELDAVELTPKQLRDFLHLNTIENLDQELETAKKTKNRALINALEKLQKGISVSDKKFTRRNLEELYLLKKGSSEDSDIFKDRELMSMMQKELTPDTMEETLNELMQIDQLLGNKNQMTPEYIAHVKAMLTSFGIVLDDNNISIDARIDTTESNTDNTVGENTANVNKVTGDIESEVISIRGNSNTKNASMSELYLHELFHSYIRGAMDIKPDIRKQMEAIRQTALKLGITSDIFIESFIASGKADSMSKQEIQAVQDRFDYIFSEGSDIEEFMAYLMSNSYLYNILYDMDISKEFESKPLLKVDNRDAEVFNLLKAQVNNIYDMLRGLFSSIRAVGEGLLGITRELDPKTTQEAIANMLKSTEQIHSKHSAIKEWFKAREDTPFIGWMITLGNITFSKSSSVLSTIHKVAGIPINSKMVKMLDWLYGIRDKAIKSLKDSNSVIIEAISKIEIVKKILRTNVLQSVYRQIVENTAKGKHKDFYTMFRKAGGIINKAVHDVKQSLIDLTREQSINNSENIILNQEFTSQILRTGSAKFFNDFLDNGYLTDEDALGERMDELEMYLVQEGLSNVAFDHLEALAKYNLDGKAHIKDQHINTNNIINEHLAVKDYETFKRVKELADEYVATIALHSSDLSTVEKASPELQEEMRQISRLYAKYDKSHYSSIVNHKNYKKYTDIPTNTAHINTEDELYTIDYIDEESIVEDDYDVYSRQDKLKAMVATKVDDTYIVVDGKKYYKAKVHNTDIGFQEGAIKLTTHNILGTSISDLIRHKLLSDVTPYSTEEINKIIDEVMVLLLSHKPIKKSLLDVGDIELIPIRDDKGYIIDYKIPLTRKDTDVTLGYKNTIADIIPHNVSRLINITQSSRNNKIVVHKLIEFYNENKDDEDIKFYKLAPNAKTTIGKEKWDKLPKALKAYILEITKNKGIYVPETVLDLMTGFREVTVADAKAKNKSVKRDSTRQMIMFAEKIVKEILGFVKGITIKLNPDVIIGNTVSNMMTAMLYGISPIEYHREFKRHYALLETFEKLTNRKTKIQMEQGLHERGSEQFRRLQREKQEITRQLNENKYKELVDDGQFTPLAEDLDETPTTYIGKKIDSYFEKTPEETMRELSNQAVINAKRNGTKAEDELQQLIAAYESKPLPKELNDIRKGLFALKGSEVDKKATQFVAYGDTITRQMIKEKSERNFKKKHNRLMNQAEKQELLNDLDMLLVNYGYINNKYQTWMEKVGGLFFMKYLFKGLKGYHIIMDRKPINVGYQQGLQALTGIDVVDALDTYSNIDNPIDPLVNREQLLHPLSVAWTATTPNVFMPLGASLDSVYK